MLKGLSLENFVKEMKLGREGGMSRSSKKNAGKKPKLLEEDPSETQMFFMFSSGMDSFFEFAGFICMGGVTGCLYVIWE